MEAIIERMQDENSGVPVKTVKSLMSKIPSVFTGKSCDRARSVAVRGMGGREVAVNQLFFFYFFSRQEPT